MRNIKIHNIYSFEFSGHFLFLYHKSFLMHLINFMVTFILQLHDLLWFKRLIYVTSQHKTNNIHTINLLPTFNFEQILQNVNTMYATVM